MSANNGSLPAQPNLDALLRDYYRAALPEPWPALEPPAPRRIPPSRSSLRSRLALAASVLFLLLGTLALAGRVADEVRPADADGPDVHVGSRPARPVKEKADKVDEDWRK